MHAWIIGSIHSMGHAGRDKPVAPSALRAAAMSNASALDRHPGASRDPFGFGKSHTGRLVR
jgi:hypothetical protein